MEATFEKRQHLELGRLTAILSAEREEFGIFAPLAALFEAFGWRAGGKDHVNGACLKVSRKVWGLICNEVARRADALAPGSGVYARMEYMNKGPSTHEEDDPDLVLVEPGFIENQGLRSEGDET